MARIAKAWPPIASALLLLLAFPPFNFGLVVFAALAPWLVSLKDTNAKGALKSGYVFGLTFMGGQFVFLFQFVYKWTESAVFGILPAFIATLITAVNFAIVGWLIHHCWKRNWPWAIPLAWAGVEVLRSSFPSLAFPWGLVHTPLHPYPILIQLSWFGSAFLVSATVVLANVIFAFLILQVPLKQIRNYALPLIVALIGAGTKESAPIYGTAKTIAIGQPNVDMAFTPEPEQTRQVGESVNWLIARAQQSKPDLLVLPEGMTSPTHSVPPQAPFQIPEGLPILFGGQRAVDSLLHQTAFGYDGKWSYADKNRLVVFGEYVPLREQLPIIKNFNMPSRDLSPGEKTRALTLNGIRVGPLLCFEALFAEVAFAQVRNDAQLLAIMSIDDWYFGTPAPEQLAAATAFRAVESGLPVVRAASQGQSLAVDSRGHVVARIKPGERTLENVNLLVPDKADSFSAIWVFPLLALISVVAIPAASLWIERRRPSAGVA